MLLFFAAACIFASFISLTDTCAASGICGLQPYCYGSQPGYGTYPSQGGYQSPYNCGRCATMYGCGSYGCYRMRAAGSTSFRPERARGSKMLRKLEQARIAAERGEEIQVSEMENLEFASPTVALLKRHPTAKINPNKAFYECCRDRKLPDACLEKCTYNTYTKDALNRMYFKQDECPLAAMSEIQFCAAQGGDHRGCCARNGVTTTIAGEKCLTFCDQRPGKVIQLDTSYISCFDRFESMKSCFYNDLTRFRSA